MESILNLIWLLIAGLAFGAYRIWAAGLPRPLASSRRRKREVALVLVCLLALLLPIISVTDDLTVDLATLDQWTAARRVNTVLLTMLVARLPGLASLAQAGAEVHRAALRLASAGVDELPALFVLSPSIVTVWSFRAPPRAVS
jgi:hypothetical protein